jgi:hypothetical protein
MNPSPTSTAPAIAQPRVDLDLRVESQERSARERALDVILRHDGEHLTHADIQREAGVSYITARRASQAFVDRDLGFRHKDSEPGSRGFTGYVYIAHPWVSTPRNHADSGSEHPEQSCEAIEVSTPRSHAGEHPAPGVYLPAYVPVVSREVAIVVRETSSPSQQAVRAEQLISGLEQRWRLAPGGIREPGRNELSLAIVANFDGVKDCVREIDRRVSQGQSIDPVAILLTKIRAGEALPRCEVCGSKGPDVHIRHSRHLVKPFRLCDRCAPPEHEDHRHHNTKEVIAHVA